jgi:multidrug resistance efflux pump
MTEFKALRREEGVQPPREATRWPGEATRSAVEHGAAPAYEPFLPGALAQMDALQRLTQLQKLLAGEVEAADKVSAATEAWRRRHTPDPQTAPDPLTAPSAPRGAATSPAAPVKIGTASPAPRRLLKTTLGLAIVAVLGYAPVQRLMQTSSVEAVVNARVITLRSPIEGEVQAGPGRTDVGAALGRGDVLFRVVDQRADRSRVDDLSRQLEQLRDERPRLAAKLASARDLLADANNQTRQFAQGRILQLQARVDELGANAAAAHVRSLDAAATLERTTRLAGQGVVTLIQATQAQRDADIAAQNEIAVGKQIEAAKVELEAARGGVFVGDSYNDRPQSAQRADELQQQVVDLDQGLAEHDRRVERMAAELSDERARYARQESAEIVAPAKGSIWEVLTAPGEQVHRGQDLVRVLDCSGALVTAVVDEAVYDRLQVGSSARFRPRDGGKDLPGRVVSLTGSTSSPANFAIQPGSMLRETYHVTVAVTDLGAQQNCGVGRTGRVIFDDDHVDLLNVLRPALP